METKLGQFSEWYIAVLAAGTLVAVAAITAGNNQALLVGLGITLFGAGEFVNHPYQARVFFDGLGRPSWQTYGRSRAASPAGMTIESIGILLFVIGIGLIVFG